jgi:hypothetical protein
MKNLILSLVLLFISFVSFSQVYEVGFSEYTNFNSCSHGKYEEVIDSANYCGRVDKSDSVIHKYVIDLTNKTIKYYSGGYLMESATIITSKKVGDLVYVTANDELFLTGTKVVSTIVINTNKNNKRYPKYAHLFFNPDNNSTSGTIATK